MGVLGCFGCVLSVFGCVLSVFGCVLGVFGLRINSLWYCCTNQVIRKVVRRLIRVLDNN